MKICSKCFIKKDLVEFSVDKQKKCGYRSDCKLCNRKRQKELRNGNLDHYRKVAKEWKKNNPEKVKIQRQKDREKNREYYLSYWKKRYKDNKEEVRIIRKKYYQENKEKVNASIKKYLNNNINARIASNLRKRYSKLITRGYKNGSAVKDLGCSVEFFIGHIEGKFKDGMSWDNYGEWHIDHIKPLSSFDLTKRSNNIIACHYTNLQPLWASDNISKGNKLNWRSDG